MGQNLEAVVVLRGQEGVNYLSRYYSSNVWFGDTNSYCDLPRILGKLHATVNLGAGITPLGKLQQKLVGLSFSDGTTPIIMQILQAAIRVGMKIDKDVVLDQRIVSYWSKYGDTDNWPNELHPDEQRTLDVHLPGADVAPLLTYLSEIKDQSQLLSMPTIQLKEAFSNVPKRLNVVVDDEIVRPETKVDEPYVPTTPSYVPQAFNSPTNNVVKAEVKKDPYAGQPICKKFLDRKCDGKNCKLRHARVCRKFQDKKCDRKDCKYEHILIK